MPTPNDRSAHKGATTASTGLRATGKTTVRFSLWLPRRRTRVILGRCEPAFGALSGLFLSYPVCAGRRSAGWSEEIRAERPDDPAPGSKDNAVQFGPWLGEGQCNGPIARHSLIRRKSLTNTLRQSVYRGAP